MTNYDPSEIEPRWQAKWEADRLYQADIEPSMPKFYALTMLPYPSGDLHIGHWFAMTPSDARARFKRMQGYNVLFPIGFDAFGLPAENAAIKRNVHPKEWTFANIDRMRRQLRSMGAMFDWRREAISADPAYYKWSQWFFKKLYENGLAYRKLAAVDYCPKDNTTLAREQVVGENRVCERCGTPVVKKELEQWFFRITKYAEELLQYPGIDWQDKVVVQQINWIGRSEGASIVFPVSGAEGEAIDVFTTRPDTLWGATFMVLAPEHPLVAKLTTDEQRTQVDAYIEQTLRQSDIQREAADEEKTGVFTGGYAVNPANGERIPVWIADYVLLTYGTGAIMAVPAHDQRDFEFARKYGLEIRPVIQPQGVELDGATMTEAYPHHGVMVNSGPFDGTPATDVKGMANPAIRAVTEWLKKKGAGRADVNYRLRDWLISRQRYWGAPIPMVHCKSCGWNPVPDEELPVLLPDDIEWMPTGESPLKLHPTWKNTTCPVCDEPAERETDTLDTFMCSSWYHLRYLSPGYDAGPVRQEDYDYWMPVDSYTGGAEHATMHLIYTRFFHKALRDMGLTEGHEPMLQYRSQGHILGPDGNRMSKSKGNVIDPDEQVRRYGADTVRAYLMFGYRWSEGGPWNTENIQGPVRWLRRVWDLFTSPPPYVKTDAGGEGGEITAAAAAAARELRRKVHQTLIQVTLSYETYQFNTIISGLMELLNAIVELGEAGAAGTPAWEEAKDIYLRLMAPAVPHIAEELWTNVLGKQYSVHQQPWPEVDEDAAREDVVMLPVQVNGKLRDRIELPSGFTQAEAEAAALASEAVQKFMDGKPVRKVIVVPGKLVNIVV